MAYNAGTAFLQVVPSFENIQRDLGEVAEQIGRRIDRAVGQALPRGMREGARRVAREARAAGRDAGAGYAQSLADQIKRRLSSATESLTKIEVAVDERPLDRAVDRIRTRLDELRDRDVTLAIDEKAVVTAVRRLRHQIQGLERQAADDPGLQHLRAARADLDALSDLASRLRRQGGLTGGLFDDTQLRKLQRALKALPEVTLHANSHPIEREIADIRDQMTDLSERIIRLDVDDDEASRKLALLEARLRAVGMSSPVARVKTDTAGAVAELTGVKKLADDIDGRDVDVRVKTDEAGSALNRLGNQFDIPIHRLGVLVGLGAALGPALIPAAAGAAVAIAGIATAAGAAVAAIGVLGLGLSGVFGAVKALSKYEEDAAKSAKSLHQAQTAVASALDGVQSAERSLANTRENVAAANRRAARSVVDAHEQVAEAERTRRRAELDLTEAIKSAQRADEDRQLSIRGTALSIRQANLDLAEARRDLDRVMFNPRASEEEREQARITYEQRVLQLDELSVRQRRLAEEQNKWNKEGVNGTDQVKTAQERLLQANKRVADSQERLTDAIAAQAQTQRQGQFQIAQATQALVSAQRSLQTAYVNSSVAGGEALDNLRVAMEKLSPAGQRFARFIFGLKDEMLALRGVAEAGLLPGLQQGLELLLTRLPQISQFVGAMAESLGRMFVFTISQLEHPAWRRFFAHMRDSAIPAFEGMVRFTEAVARGLGSLVVALSPFNRSMGEGLLSWAEGFATWAEKLDQTQGFQEFLAYVREAGPAVIDLLRELLLFIKNLAIAAAPVGLVVVELLTGLLDGLNSLPIGLLQTFLAVWAGFSTVMLINKAAMVSWRAVTATVTSTATNFTRVAGGMHRFFVNTPERVSALTRAQLGFNAALTRGAIAIAPVVTGLQRLGGGFVSRSATTSTAAVNAHTAATTRLAPAAAVAAGALQRLAQTLGLGAVAAPLATRAVGVYVSTVGAASAVMTAASGAALRFAFTLQNVAGAAVGATTRAVSGLVSILGGPWGVALTAATLAFVHFTGKAAEQRSENKALRDSLIDLADAFRRTDGSAMESVEGMVRQNVALRELIINSQRFGLTVADIVAATEGDAAARAKVISAYDQEIVRLHRLLAEHIHLRDVKGGEARQQEILNELGVKDRAGIGALIEARERERDAIAASTGEKVRANAAANLIKGSNLEQVRAQQALNAAMRDGASAANILRSAYQSLYGDAVNREQALLREREAYDRLRESVQKNGATLNENTAEGRENRRAIGERITALNDLALADIAATGTISADTQRRIDKLRDELLQMGFNRGEVDKMIARYQAVPPKILTQIILDGGANAQGILNETGKKAVELIATYNLKPEEAMAIAKGGIPVGWWPKNLPGRLGAATGGYITGPGTTTSDSIPAMLSNREYVQQAAAVDYYGVPFMHALNQQAIPREHVVPGFAWGGYVGKWAAANKTNVMGVPSWEEMRKYNQQMLERKLAELESARKAAMAGGPGDTGPGPGFPPWPSSPGASRGDSGVWRSIHNLVRSSGLPWTWGNAYRHGDPLWHGSGRAIDYMGYNQDALAQFFMDFRPRVLELIHTTDKGGYYITRGRRKSSMGRQDALHRNHLHIAMDQGGWLQEGWNPPIWNGTGSPEAVLTPSQSKALVTLAEHDGSSGPQRVYNFAFRDTDLTASRLRAMQDADAAYERAGRAR